MVAAKHSLTMKRSLLPSFLLVVGTLLNLVEANYNPLRSPVYVNRTIPKVSSDALYLTPYINSGDIETAQKLSRIVQPLIGLEEGQQKQPDGYSGFLTVDERLNNNMFFWFIPATDVDPKEAPVVLWLQGGPGASSLFGLMEVHGPIQIVADINGIPVPQINQYAWTTNANIIYMDNPVGAGFSYSETNDGLPTTDAEATEGLYEALVQWFKMFPEYRSNEFHAFGESYAGKFVPCIAKKIHDMNAAGAEVQINLVGLGIGDGFMSPPDSSIYADFLYQASLVNAKQRDVMKKFEDQMKAYADQGKWEKCWEAWNSEFSYFMTKMGCDYVYDFTQCYYDKEEDDYEIFLNLQITRDAIHVGERPFGAQSESVYTSMLGDFMSSQRATIEFLLEHYKVLVYDGNLDIICNHSGILEMFYAMTNWSGREEFIEAESIPFEVSSEVVGSLTSVRNLRMVVIKNAGHMVARSQPRNAFEMFNSFIRGSL